jgi:hypothetical protein
MLIVNPRNTVSDTEDDGDDDDSPEPSYYETEDIPKSSNNLPDINLQRITLSSRNPGPAARDSSNTYDCGEPLFAYIR